METYLLATMSYQTMIASKAARIFTAARGRQIVDFGARRAHGSQASLLAARAAAIGGCGGTSNVLAGHQFGMETYGTQAHSWVMAHEDESEAFGHFLDAFPEHAVLLLDTYDVRNAVKKIIAMGRKPAGVRLDSGNLAKDSQWVRAQLDAVGWKDVKIFASGDLDETRIASLLSKHAAIDAFGVGTALATPGDAPHLNLVYKLVEVERDGKVREAAKLSAAKVTYPGRKQVFRYSKPSGEYKGDKISLDGEAADGGEPMLIEVMRGGRRTTPAEAVIDSRARCLAGLGRLPARYRRIDRSAVYPVAYTKRLESHLEKLRKRIMKSAPK
jgi:nicotinate phosphoribosyltransferase